MDMFGKWNGGFDEGVLEFTRLGFGGMSYIGVPDMHENSPWKAHSTPLWLMFAPVFKNKNKWNKSALLVVSRYKLNKSPVMVAQCARKPDEAPSPYSYCWRDPDLERHT